MTEIQNSVSAGDSQQTLCLTLNRSSQQARLNELKAQMRGKRFRKRSTPPKFCRAHAIAFLKYKNGQLKEIRLDRIPCNSWTCPACCVSKAFRVQRLIQSVALMNNLKYFITFTLDPKIIPVEYMPEGDNLTQKYITKLFNTLLTNIRRLVKRLYGVDTKIKYVWVIQFQKNGNAHMHVLLDTRLPIDEVREIWKRIGGGAQMYVERVKSLESAAYYVSRYIVTGIKDSDANSWFHYFERRYFISKYCERPTFSTKQMFDKSVPKTKQWATLYNKKLVWLYNALEENTFTDGTIISAPENTQ